MKRPHATSGLTMAPNPSIEEDVHRQASLACGRRKVAMTYSDIRTRNNWSIVLGLVGLALCIGGTLFGAVLLANGATGWAANLAAATCGLGAASIPSSIVTLVRAGSLRGKVRQAMQTGRPRSPHRLAPRKTFPK
jgi:hypothetical protein